MGIFRLLNLVDERKYASSNHASWSFITGLNYDRTKANCCLVEKGSCHRFQAQSVTLVFFVDRERKKWHEYEIVANMERKASINQE